MTARSSTACRSGRQPSDEVWHDDDAVRRPTGESIEYSLERLISFVETYPDPDLVLVVLGDHQPHACVSGDDAGHDVPITVIAQDRASCGGSRPGSWPDGLLPPARAPVWPMDELP